GVDSTDSLNNLNWSFVSGTTRYWVGNSGNWSDAANHWAASSGGTAGSANAPVAGDNVVFDANSGSGTVTIDTAGVSLGNLIDSSPNITIATSTNGIAVAGNLAVNGTLSGTAAVTVSGTSKTISGTGTISAPLTLGADYTINVNSGTLTISGVISGAYAVTKTGSGTAVFSGTNTFTGALTVSEGTISVPTVNNDSADGPLGNNAGVVTLGSSGKNVTFKYTGANVTSTKKFTMAGGSSNSFQVDTAGATLTLSGVIDGSGALCKTGSQTSMLMLGGENTFSGGVTIKAGIVAPSTSANAAGTGTITIGDTGGSASATLHVVTNLTIGNAIAVASGSSGALSIKSYAPTTFSNTITLANNISMGAGGGWGSDIECNGDINGTGTITVDSVIGSIIAINGAIGSDITGIIQNSSASQLQLSGDNSSYARGVTIKKGTVVLLTSNNAVGTGTITLGDISGSDNARLQIGPGLTIGNAVTVESGSSGTATIGPYDNSWSEVTVSGAITLSKSLTVNNAGSSPITFSGGITGTGNLTIDNKSNKAFNFTTGSIDNTGTITNQGAGTSTTTISATIGSHVTGITQNSSTSKLLLSGNNSTVGGVTISSGTLELSGTTNLNLSGNWTNSVGTAGFAANSSTVTLTGSGQKLLGSTAFYNLTKNISGGSADTLYFQSGQTQAATGALTLTGALGKILTLRSCDSSGTQTDGTQWKLQMSGTGSVTYVDVKDSDASPGKTVTATYATDSSNNLNWNISAAGVGSTVKLWKGGTSNVWALADNWKLTDGVTATTVPSATDTVYIDGSYTNAPVTTASATTTIGTLVTSGASTLTLGSGGNLTVSGDCNIYNGSTVTYTQGAAADLTVNGTLTIAGGGTLTCPYTDLTTTTQDSQGNTVAGGKGRTITAANITIDLGGSLNADGCGFGAAAGPGIGNSGGSHGGRGGDYNGSGTVGNTYGDFTNPVSLGSGSTSNSSGSKGGGAIIISSTGTVTVNGTLSANSSTANLNYSTGSGGSINITAGTLTGSGVIQANALNANTSTGAGGRISLYNVTTDTFSGTLEAKGGTNTYNNCGARGYAGTICLSNTKRSNLVIGGTGNISSLRLGSDGT
ncbi:MAG: autotransporter-associated beta strand repeat-containing protein, partial [Dehalococcoidales bacterium]|nr:autotransporter-associated beta strand repeat-containing protein [Dehalococcoidales bacterium]